MVDEVARGSIAAYDHQSKRGDDWDTEQSNMNRLNDCVAIFVDAFADSKEKTQGCEEKRRESDAREQRSGSLQWD